MTMQDKNHSVERLTDLCNLTVTEGRRMLLVFKGKEDPVECGCYTATACASDRMRLKEGSGKSNS